MQDIINNIVDKTRKNEENRRNGSKTIANYNTYKSAVVKTTLVAREQSAKITDASNTTCDAINIEIAMYTTQIMAKFTQIARDIDAARKAGNKENETAAIARALAVLAAVMTGERTRAAALAGHRLSMENITTQQKNLESTLNKMLYALRNCYQGMQKTNPDMMSAAIDINSKVEQFSDEVLVAINIDRVLKKTELRAEEIAGVDKQTAPRVRTDIVCKQQDAKYVSDLSRVVNDTKKIKKPKVAPVLDEAAARRVIEIFKQSKKNIQTVLQSVIYTRDSLEKMKSSHSQFMTAFNAEITNLQKLCYYEHTITIKQ